MIGKDISKTTAVETTASPEYYNGKEDGVEVGGSSTGSPEIVQPSYAGVDEGHEESQNLSFAIQQLESKRKHWYSYLLTKEFWIVLALG